MSPILQARLAIYAASLVRQEMTILAKGRLRYAWNYIDGGVAEEYVRFYQRHRYKGSGSLHASLASIWAYRAAIWCICDDHGATDGATDHSINYAIKAGADSALIESKRQELEAAGDWVGPDPEFDIDE